MSTSNSSEKTSILADAIRKKISDRFGAFALFNERLAPHVAYGVGGPADVLIFPKSEADLIWLADLKKQTSLPLTIIGKGTNLLVRDEGIRGITLSLAHALKDIAEAEGGTPGKTVWVSCGGGVGKPDLLEWAIARGLGGLEFSAGVPGTIGGGIFMNAGTKYGCYGDILRKLRMFDFDHGLQEIETKANQFGYREQKLVKNHLVINTVFELHPTDPSALRNEVDRIIAERAAKQPLDFPSCGSTFKNPDGYSAGRLIEKAGLKGLSVGGAQISEKHANFILNKGNAKASDILKLIEIAKQRVREQFSVELECEVIVLGG